jgi:hypothetical protein
MSRVWESSSQKGGKLLCLLAIADFSNDNGVAFPGIETLARKTRMSVRQVQRVIQELSSAGELLIEANAGPKGCHLYRIILRQNGGGDILTGGVTFPAQNVTGGGDIPGPEMSPEPSGTVSTNRQEPKENRKESRFASREAFEAITLPANLDTPQFRAAWNDWYEYRRLSGKGTLLAFTRVLMRLSEHGPVRSIKAINKSIENEWSGLFPEKENPSPNGASPSPAFDDVHPDFLNAQEIRKRNKQWELANANR